MPLRAVEPLQEKLAHPAAFSVATSRLHYLAHEKPDNLFVAVPYPLRLIWIGSDDLVNYLGELVAAHRGKALALYNRRRGLAGLED